MDEAANFPFGSISFNFRLSRSIVHAMYAANIVDEGSQIARLQSACHVICSDSEVTSIDP